MALTRNDITAGETYVISFPRGMHKTDFTKCLTMARRNGSYDGAARTWEITPQGSHGTAVVAEMADRGAIVECTTS